MKNKIIIILKQLFNNLMLNIHTLLLFAGLTCFFVPIFHLNVWTGLFVLGIVLTVLAFYIDRSN